MKTVILYIDDDFGSLRLVERLLARSDYSFVGVRNAERGLKRAQEVMPSLILMNVELPGISGYEATVKMRSMPTLATVPIVALTARAMEGDRERALAVGCQGYIAKPIDVNRFVELIDRYLAGETEFITDSDRARYLAEHHQRLVERLEVMSAEIAGTVAHELNQPLSIIAGLNELMASECAPAQQVRLALMSKEITRMAEIIERLSGVTGHHTKQYFKEQIVNLEEASALTPPVELVAGNQDVGWALVRKMAWFEERLRASEQRIATAQVHRRVLHTLNNHLQSVRGYTDLFLISQEADEQWQYVGKVSEATDRCIDLLRAFYELLSISSGVAEQQQCSFDQLLHDVVALLEKVLSKHNVSFFVNVQPGDYLSGLPRRSLIYLLLALLYGATEDGNSPRGSTIECRLEAQGSGRARFSVDVQFAAPLSLSNAPEIAMSDELATSLFVVQSIVNEVGGFFEHQLHRHRYRFILELPLRDKTLCQTIVPITERRSSPMAVPRLLVVDDEQSICFVMRQHLEARFGPVVDTCHSAEDAQIMLERSCYGLILLDVNLPGASGLDILPKLRARYPELNILVITGLISTEDYQKAMSEGAKAVLLKPIRRQELYKALDKLELPGRSVATV